MADPFTLTAASMGASALGGVTQAVGQIFSGSAQSNQYKYQAGVARMNAQVARQNAAYSRYSGEFESQRSGMKSRYERGQTVATQSGRGVVVGEGSPGQVTESIGNVGQQEQRTIRGNAARRAYGYDIEASSQDAAANMYGKAAQRSKLASYISAGGTLLSTAGNVSGKWLQASQMGVGQSSLPALSPDAPHEFEGYYLES